MAKKKSAKAADPQPPFSKTQSKKPAKSAPKKSAPKKAAQAATPPITPIDKKQNLKPSDAGRGFPTTDHDEKHRMGNFTGAGEAPRKGGRNSGIVGQTTKKSRTDKKTK